MCANNQKTQHVSVQSALAGGVSHVKGRWLRRTGFVTIFLQDIFVMVLICWSCSGDEKVFRTSERAQNAHPPFGLPSVLGRPSVGRLGRSWGQDYSTLHGLRLGHQPVIFGVIFVPGVVEGEGCSRNGARNKQKCARGARYSRSTERATSQPPLSIVCSVVDLMD